MSPDLDGKRQDILIEAVPGAPRIAALADSNVATLRHLQALEEAARAHGKELLVVRAAKAEPPPHATLASRRPATALPGPDSHRLIPPAWPAAFLHSITSSASASNLSGTVNPSAFAVLRLMISSYFVGACTGRSDGLVPRKILLT